MARHAGAAPIRYQMDFMVVSILQQAPYIVTAVGVGDTIREYLNVTTAHSEPVRQALTPGVTNTLNGIGGNQVVGPQSA